MAEEIELCIYIFVGCYTALQSSSQVLEIFGNLFSTRPDHRLITNYTAIRAVC